jgi:hypothetical protein
MASHAGFDRLTYPGDEIMRLLWEKTNLAWTGFYLAPAPSQHYTGWMGKRSFLSGLGWGFAPIYVGQQTEGAGSHIVTANQGSIDAADAAMLARRAGFPGRSVIYLDVEQSPTSDRNVIKQITDYYKSWVQGVFDQGFYPGVSCFPMFAIALMVADPRPTVWAIGVRYGRGTYRDPFPNPDPEKSGYSFANMWQLAQAATLEVTDDHGRIHRVSPIDFDSADSTDPSNFLNFTAIA